MNMKAVLETTHALPTQSSAPGFIKFDPVEFLVRTQKVAFLSKPTLRYLINAPSLITFLIFSDPPDLVRAPPFINFNDNKVFYELLILFPYFVSTIHSHFSRQHGVLLYLFYACLTCFCFSFRRFIIILSRLSTHSSLF